MAEKYKLALSRSRLFEPDNVVIFCGKFNCASGVAQHPDALERLAKKEPVITAGIELLSDSSAYVVINKFEPKFEFYDYPKDDIVSFLEKEPFKFYNKLFRFIISNDGYLVIAGHTAVCDAKSLLRIAGYLVSLEDENQPLSANKIFTFSEPKSLPVDVVSPLTNKLSAELDNKWHKSSRKFSVADYDAMMSEYIKRKKEISSISLDITEVDISQTYMYCRDKGVDLSALVCFCFYKSIVSNCEAEKSASKMRVYGDRRFFHGSKENYSVGAYNGTVNVGLNKRELAKPIDEQLKLFHLDYYRALTSPFRVFYEDVLLMQVDPTLCDSSYMTLAGLERNKVSRSFAETHGCASRQLCDCQFYNLKQQFWSNLSCYSSVMVSEPFKARSNKMLTCVFDEKGAHIIFKCDMRYTDKNTANKIMNDALSLLKSFV